MLGCVSFSGFGFGLGGGWREFGGVFRFISLFSFVGVLCIDLMVMMMMMYTSKEWNK